MRYRDAKKLNNEDEVVVKETGNILRVISTKIYEKSVIVGCDDGNEYHHTELK